MKNNTVITLKMGLGLLLLVLVSGCSPKIEMMGLRIGDGEQKVTAAGFQLDMGSYWSHGGKQCPGYKKRGGYLSRDQCPVQDATVVLEDGKILSIQAYLSWSSRGVVYREERAAFFTKLFGTPSTTEQRGDATVLTWNNNAQGEKLTVEDRFPSFSVFLVGKMAE